MSCAPAAATADQLLRVERRALRVIGLSPLRHIAFTGISRAPAFWQDLRVGALGESAGLAFHLGALVFCGLVVVTVDDGRRTLSLQPDVGRRGAAIASVPAGACAALGDPQARRLVAELLDGSCPLEVLAAKAELDPAVVYRRTRFLAANGVLALDETLDAAFRRPWSPRLHASLEIGLDADLRSPPWVESVAEDWAQAPPLRVIARLLHRFGPMPAERLILQLQALDLGAAPELASAVSALLADGALRLRRGVLFPPGPG